VQPRSFCVPSRCKILATRLDVIVLFPLHITFLCIMRYVLCQFCLSVCLSVRLSVTLFYCVKVSHLKILAKIPVNDLNVKC